MLFYIFDVFFHDKKILSAVLPPITQHTTLCIIYSVKNGVKILKKIMRIRQLDFIVTFTSILEFAEEC